MKFLTKTAERAMEKCAAYIGDRYRGWVLPATHIEAFLADPNGHALAGGLLGGELGHHLGRNLGTFGSLLASSRAGHGPQQALENGILWHNLGGALGEVAGGIGGHYLGGKVHDAVARANRARALKRLGLLAAGVGGLGALGYAATDRDEE